MAEGQTTRSATLEREVGPFTTRMRVSGMDCASCAMKIENALARLPWVLNVDVSVTRGTVTAKHGKPEAKEFRSKVEGLGYAVTGLSMERDERDQAKNEAAPDKHTGHAHMHDDTRAGHRWWQTGKGDQTISTATALALAFVVDSAIPSVAWWAFFVAMMVGLAPIAKRAMSAAMAGAPFSIEMLMTVAAIGAIFIGATEETATVAFLFLVGELLEGAAASRARASIQDLTKLVPGTARLESADGAIREVEGHSLVVGSVIQVRPGERIAANGVIISGESSVNEAPVTGESTPTLKEADALVFAGTVNGDGLLRVRVTAAAADNTIARVVRLVGHTFEARGAIPQTKALRSPSGGLPISIVPAHHCRNKLGALTTAGLDCKLPERSLGSQGDSNTKN